MTKEEMLKQGIDPAEVARIEKQKKYESGAGEFAEKIEKALKDEPERVKAYREELKREAVAEIAKAIAEGTEEVLTTNPLNPYRYKQVYNYERKRWEWKSFR